MARSVTLKQLAAVLAQFGFTKTEVESVVSDDVEFKNVIIFYEAERDALIAIPQYDDDEIVRPVHVGMAETTLYYKGIAERSEFDELLKQAAQPKAPRHRAQPEVGGQASRTKIGASDQIGSKGERDVKSPAKRATAAMRLTNSSVAKA